MQRSKVFILYTGGTFGMRPASEGSNSLEPGSWEQIMQYMPSVNNHAYFDHFKNVDFSFDTLDPVVDSSDISPKTWQDIAAVIQANYEDYSGFVVIHGTDTMAYTASALSFILEGLDKPVILTGSQLPVFHPRTDAITNLSNAIYLAAYDSFEIEKIPEVCICFNDDILRGNRSVKSSTLDFEGFSSPNHDNLGHLEQDILINSNLLRKAGDQLNLKTGFSEKVVNVTIFPGYNPSVLLKLVNEGEIEGVVLKTFGAGNLPHSPIWNDLVQACEAQGVLILAMTQCQNGSIDLGKYKSSQVLMSKAVVGGYDISSEAALTKLMWVIGNYPKAERANILASDLRGEITAS